MKNLFQDFAYKLFLIRHALLKENKILTALTNREKERLFNLAAKIEKGNILEIGSAFGASACFLAKGLGKGNILFCIDKWNVEYRKVGNEVINLMYMADGNIYEYKYNEMLKKMDFVFFEKISQECITFSLFKKNVKRFKDKIVAIQEDSIEASKGFIERLDLIFIDGWHMYDSVSADCQAWLPKLKSGGVIILHDYAWAEGVQRAVKEYVIPFVDRHEEFENMFIGWKG